MKFNLETISLIRDNIFTFFFCSSVLIFGLFGVLGFTFLSIATVWGLIAFGLVGWKFSKNTKIIYISLSSIYFVFFFRSLFSQNFGDLFWEMGPVLPLLILPILVFLSPFQRLSLSPNRVGRLTTLSSLTVLAYFLLAKYHPDFLSFLGLKNTVQGRFEALHGNAVPFSVVILSLGCFSLIGWRSERFPFRFLSLISFLWSAYAVVFQSQVRSQVIVVIIFTIAIAIAIAIAVKKGHINKTLMIGVILALLFGSQLSWVEKVDIPKRNFAIFDILLTKKLNSSDKARVAMWNAGYETFQKSPVLGIGYENRFEPLKSEHAPKHIKRYKHLHNDVLTGSIIAGVFGGISVVLLFFSPIVAWFLFNRSSIEVFLLASALTTIFFAAGLSNTILFNDVTPAWLVLSSLLIAKIDCRKI